MAPFFQRQSYTIWAFSITCINLNGQFIGACKYVQYSKFRPSTIAFWEIKSSFRDRPFRERYFTTHYCRGRHLFKGGLIGKHHFVIIGNNSWFSKEEVQGIEFSDISDLKNVLNIDIDTTMIFKGILKSLGSYKIDESSTEEKRRS